jgi:hypothetical protein
MERRNWRKTRERNRRRAREMIRKTNKRRR